MTTVAEKRKWRVADWNRNEGQGLNSDYLLSQKLLGRPAQIPKIFEDY